MRTVNAIKTQTPVVKSANGLLKKIILTFSELRKSMMIGRGLAGDMGILNKVKIPTGDGGIETNRLNSADLPNPLERRINNKQLFTHAWRGGKSLFAD